MQAIPMVLGVGAAVIGGIGQYQQSQYNAQVAQNNAIVAEQNADRAVQTAAIRAQEQDIEAQGELGALIARSGASGLSLGVGSIAKRIDSKKLQAKGDRDNIIYQGEADAVNFKNQAQDFRSERKMQKRAGQFALVSTAFDVGSSLISSATKVNAKKAASLG